MSKDSEQCAAEPQAEPTEQSTSLDLPDCMFRSGQLPEVTTIEMQRRLKGIRTDEAKFTEVDGWALFEGDIVLESAEEARQAVARGTAIKGDKYRWPNGVIAYETIDILKPLVTNAIAHWEQRTPIRFKAHTNETDFISFEHENGCWSRVGRQGGKQVISLGDGCGLGSAIHEIGHALGLWHEQSRADRDQHITVRYENVIEAYKHNFDKHILDGDDLGSYDHGSIMHYPGTAFSKNGQPTIVTKDGESIGQRNGLSRSDILTIQLIYTTLDWTRYV
jgi:hypothetical protein